MKSSAVKSITLHEVFIHELCSIYNAELQIVEALPAVIKAAENKSLKEAIQNHLQETREQVNRLNEIFEILNIQPREIECQPIQAMIADCEELIAALPKSAIRDAALIAKAQIIEHFEIAVYGTLRTFADELELPDEVERNLKATLKEEANADKKLTEIAEGGFFTSGINKEAFNENNNEYNK